MRYIIFTISFACATQTWSQHLKMLDFQEMYAQSKVVQEDRWNYTCENNFPVDSCAYGSYQFDAEGRLVEATDHFACGRVFSRQTFEYDASGDLVRNIIYHTFNKMVPVEIDLIRNDAGQIVERILQQRIPNYWFVERIERAENGKVLAIRQFRKEGENMKQFWEQSYLPWEAEMKRRSFNTMTDIYDQKGLHLLHHVYDQRGLSRITKYFYTFSRKR